MEYGDKIALFKNLQAQGRATPLDDEVQLTDTAIWYINVFELLTRERNLGTNLEHIPPSILFNYADRFELIGSLEEFIKVVCSMDDIYLKYQSDENKKRQQRESSKRQRPRK